MNGKCLFTLLFIAIISCNPTKPEDGPLMGMWKISSYRLNGNLRNIDEVPGVISIIIFQDHRSGQIWFMDYGATKSGSPMGFNYSYTEESGGEKVLSFVTSTGIRNLNAFCYVKGNELTLMYEAGTGYHGIDVSCIYNKIKFMTHS